MRQIGGLVFALAVGLAVAWYAYERVTDPDPGVAREREEAIVLRARDIVSRTIAPGATLEIVDPLAPNRVAGKVYIYPSNGGFEVSGYYRRSEAGGFHPWLMRLEGDGTLVSLTVRDDDPELIERAAADPRLSAEP